MMTTHPHTDARPLAWPAAPLPASSWPVVTARPADHLVCDPQGPAAWSDDLATAMLAGAQALLVGVHALPDAADGQPRVLLSLRPRHPDSLRPGRRNFWRTCA